MSEMIGTKSIGELKLGDVISYDDIDYKNDIFERYECMLVSLERHKSYTLYKFIVIASDGSRYAIGKHLYLQYYDKHVRVNFCTTSRTL